MLGRFRQWNLCPCRRLGRRDRSEMRDLQSDFDAVQSAAVEHAVFWWRGGAGFPERVCDRDRFVSGIRFALTAEASHPFVDFIELTCTPLVGGGAPNTLCIETGPGTVCPSGGFVQTCPAGNPAATGIRGRSGLYVDALGLICGPKPATIPPSAEHERPEACPTGDEVPEEWREMLNAHNERRRQHCVPSLAWSNTLQKEAQAWADQCKLQHGVPNGENLARAIRL